ncbi:MAG: UDP-3-O-acylglucosamine N-acyltransferase [Chlamydiia bacterium]|nr:UDP-3-O-acylglucosamine N-acyltransferase [Chlamydiia bacterium]MCH9615879.1 UDP-3-O-acylglucosamine N-acyltransferase [Chlamydiia bacterium]MCH9628718.1 UDP-3-O-acylglucosamine N-acyltransferase [Chlamydiia bacterium]
MTPRFTLAHLAKKTGATVVGDESFEIDNVAGLDTAQQTDVSFLANSKYLEMMHASSAGVICISDKMELPEGKNFLVSSDPSRTFQQIAELIMLVNRPKSAFKGIHPKSFIHESCEIDENVTVAPGAVIDQKCKIGKNTVISSNVSIGPGVTIGEGCFINSGVIIREGCRLGDRVVLQPGVVIGSCGFGFTTDKAGKHHKLDQIGIVVLESDVDVGANTTIDRARFKATVIKRGTMIDNLVQIAHNVEVGEDCIIVSQTGIAGSTKLGNRVTLGGQVGIVGHVELSDDVIVTSRGGVSKNLKCGIYRGEPVVPIKEYSEEKVHIRRLKKYAQELKSLKQKLIEVEEKLTIN